MADRVKGLPKSLCYGTVSANQRNDLSQSAGYDRA
jgi:hypothetical protein